MREERNQQIDAAINRLVEAKELVTHRMQQRQARGDEAEAEEEAEGTPQMSGLLQERMVAEKNLEELLRKYRCQEPWFRELLRHMRDKLPQGLGEEDQEGAPITPAAARKQLVEHREGVEKVRRRDEEIAATDLGVMERIQAETEYHDVLHPAA